MTTLSYRLECAGCGRYLGHVPWLCLCTGIVRWAPSLGDELIYLRCRCGVTSRFEIAPNLTQDELLQAFEHAPEIPSSHAA